MQNRPLRAFISYAHRDGSQLARRLYDALQDRGVSVWLDQARLHGGATWTAEIERAIDSSEVVLAIVSPGAYESDLCRAEQQRSLRKSKNLIPLLACPTADRPLAIETKQYIDFSDAARFDQALEKLFLDITNHVGDVARAAHPRTFVAAPPLPPNFVPRTDVLDKLRQTVLSEQTARQIAITSIRGMGGIGKTILAQALCHDEVIQDAFPDGIAWVSVGRQPRDLLGLIRETAATFGHKIEGFDTAQGCGNELRKLLRDKAALVVIDDVWDSRHIEPFRADAPRCRLLFTTRDARISTALGAEEYEVATLSVPQAACLLARWARRDSRTLPPRAEQIARECGYLPLAIAMVGAMLSSPCLKYKTCGAENVLALKSIYGDGDAEEATKARGTLVWRRVAHSTRPSVL